MDVPLVAPTREYAEFREEIDAAVRAVMESGRFVLGETVERFETAVARYLGVTHAVGVGSGTDALRLGLEATGIGVGDEVITSPFTFVATPGAIMLAGATPVFADIDPETFNLDPEAVEAAVTPATAAIMPVHLFGQMADMEALEDIATRHGLAMVEDAAQALGAWQTRAGSGPGSPASDPAAVVHAGGTGMAGCFSFYPTKNLAGIGDGGLVTTSDPEVANRLRTLREPGRWSGSPERTEVGYNSRLDAVQAAVLSVKLEVLDEWNDRRRVHAAIYDEALASVEGITPPPERAGNRHIYHQYTMRCLDRTEVQARLSSGGIGYGVYYPIGVHRIDALAHLGYAEGAFPEAERAAEEVLSLPVFAHLTEAERDHVVATLV